MSRRDDIGALYKPSKQLEKCCFFLFIGDALLSAIAIFASKSAIPYLTTGLIIIAFLYMVISIIDDGILWFRAESARRKNSIQNAFGVRLEQYDTDGYYNNAVSDPDLKYATNIFESAFFTLRISEKMLPKAIIKGIVAFIALVVSCRWIEKDDLLLIIAQAVFSAFIIEDSIQLIIFVQRIKKLYEEAYHEFVTVGITKNEQVVWLRYFCVEYECIKSHYRIRLDENVFINLNAKLSEEWQTMLSQIRYSVK